MVTLEFGRAPEHFTFTFTLPAYSLVVLLAPPPLSHPPRPLQPPKGATSAERSFTVGGREGGRDRWRGETGLTRALGIPREAWA